MASVQQAPAVQHPGPGPINQAQVQEMFMVRSSMWPLAVLTPFSVTKLTSGVEIPTDEEAGRSSK